eukprot:Hpha_TRINITY_DN15815_c2_g1::TRINITY_DN15815_c2_g1_i3::g.189636::m.189636/K08341/GABARAP, ATG8, LC3; GABA(A) receptor-associated protein
MGCKSSKPPTEEEWRARKTQQWVNQPNRSPYAAPNDAGSFSGMQRQQSARGSVGSGRGWEPTSPHSHNSAISVHSGQSSVGAPSYEGAKGFHARAHEANSLLKKHRDKVPVIFENTPDSDLPQLSNPKMLIPASSDVGHLISTVRERMRLPPNKKMFLTTRTGRTPDLRVKMSALYATNKSDDGFLYVWYSSKKFSSFWWK